MTKYICTREDILKLREMTGKALMSCKDALKQTEGNLEKAKEILRKKGLAKGHGFVK